MAQSVAIRGAIRGNQRRNQRQSEAQSEAQSETIRGAIRGNPRRNQRRNQERSHLDPREHELARAHQIPHAPGRATYNVDACAQPLKLRTWIHAT